MARETVVSTEERSESLEIRTLEFQLGSILRVVLCGVAGVLLITNPYVNHQAGIIGLAIYLLFGLFVLALTRMVWEQSLVYRAIVLAGMFIDLVFVTWLIYLDGGLGSSLFLLYGFLLLKGVLCYPLVPESLILSLLFVPLYAGAVYAVAGSLQALRSTSFLMPFGLLVILTLLGFYVAWSLKRRQEQIRRLYDLLGFKSADLERKTSILQRTASDLSEKVVELRSLQEGIKAISSALALEDVLRLIVDNASQVLRGSPCYLALADTNAERPRLATMTAAGDAPLTPASRQQLERIAAWITSVGQPVSVNDLSKLGRFAAHEGNPPSALIGAPLLVDGQPIGALMATSPVGHPFEADQLGFLTAFADQAAVAVKNARLYRDLAMEKRRTEEKSHELEAIVRGIGDGIIVTDAERRLLLMNPRAAQIFGLREMPASSQPLDELIPNKELLELLDDTLRSTEQVAVREIALPPVRDKHPVYQGLAAKIMNADGELAGIVTVLRDITGQKELERMKSNFLSVVSHELKTPLHSIKGFVDIILMGKTGPINAIQRDFLNTVKEQTAQLQRLINDLLEFSRLESGQVKLHPQEVELAGLADEVMEKLAPLAEEGRVKLISTLPADFPTVEADRVRLEQVLTNLIDNAIKFTPAGGSITISGEHLGDRVRLRVTDTGIGIPMEERERIFDRFYQVDSGSTRSYRGTGLGLTICKHIVEQHQGRIWVEGREGEGATFVVELPRKLSREQELSLDFSTLPSKSGTDQAG